MHKHTHKITILSNMWTWDKGQQRSWDIENRTKNSRTNTDVTKDWISSIKVHGKEKPVRERLHRDSLCPVLLGPASPVDSPHPLCWTLASLSSWVGVKERNGSHHEMSEVSLKCLSTVFLCHKVSKVCFENPSATSLHPSGHCFLAGKTRISSLGLKWEEGQREWHLG